MFALLVKKTSQLLIGKYHGVRTKVGKQFGFARNKCLVDDLGVANRKIVHADRADMQFSAPVF